MNPAGVILGPNVDAPIYTPGKLHMDAWVSYGFKMPWAGRILCKAQFNVADLTSNGYLSRSRSIWTGRRQPSASYRRANTHSA